MTLQPARVAVALTDLDTVDYGIDRSMQFLDDGSPMKAIVCLRATQTTMKAMKAGAKKL